MGKIQRLVGEQSILVRKKLDEVVINLNELQEKVKKLEKRVFG